MADDRVLRPTSIRIADGGGQSARELMLIAGSGVTFSTELVDGRLELTVDAAGGSAAWADITGTPTTLAGYGITDACSDAELSAHVAAGDPHPAYALEAALGSAAALNASTSRAANGIVQLDTLGLTAIGAILADERWNVARFVAANNSTDQLGMAAPSFAGTAKTPTTKVYASREASANAGFFQGTRICDTAVGFAYAIGFKVPVAITPRRIWVGLTSTTQSDSDTASGHYIGLRYSTVAGDAGWTVVSRDGTTQTVGSVGAVPVAGVPYLAVLVKEPGAGTVSLVLHRLDNNTTPLSATVSATLPAGGTAIDFIVLSWGQGTLNAIELSHATRITPLT